MGTVEPSFNFRSIARYREDLMLSILIMFKISTRKISLFNILLALFIILWGAWVRLSGSGAGCGDHWPLCNGEVIPLSPDIKTFTEFTHRLTSGFFGITVLWCVFLAFRDFPKKHPIRYATVIAFILTIIEALIGAILVKKGLVVDNSSTDRAIIIALHLVNTLLLLASLVACFYFSSAKNYLKKKRSFFSKTLTAFLVMMLLLVGASGAITALGNTLFPENSLLEGFQNDFNPASHFLTKLRVIHPLLAIIFVFSTLGAMRFFRKESYLKRATLKVEILAVVALIFGAVNWMLMAPTWGALLHLALADFLCMGLVLVFLNYFAQANPSD